MTDTKQSDTPIFKSHWKTIGDRVADGSARYYDAEEVDAYLANMALRTLPPDDTTGDPEPII